MKRLAFYPFLLLFEIIKTNKVKFGMILFCLLCGHYIMNNNDRTIEKRQLLYESEKFGFCVDIDKHIYTKYEIKDNTILYEDEDPLYALSLVFGGFSLLGLLLITFILDSDDTVGWEVDECLDRAFSYLIKCEIDNGEYCYSALGRLIDKKKDKINTTKLAERLNIGFHNIFNCPKWESVVSKRNSKLKQLGI